MTISLPAETRDAPDLFGPKEENYTLRLTVRVLTEDGKPLENADVHVAIANFNDFKDGSNDIRGKTDKDGKFSMEGIGRPEAIIAASLEGYYSSRKDYMSYAKFDEARKTGKYVPQEPVIELILKKIGKPIPMIVCLNNSASKDFPVFGEDIGFDLFEADWVIPHGKGKVADLKIKRTLADNNDVAGVASGEVKFGNEDDGLIAIMELIAPESRLQYPRTAPKNGYEIKLVDIASPINPARNVIEKPEPVGYLFRIRTRRDETTGKIISAHYGKIIAKGGVRRPTDNPFRLVGHSVVEGGKRKLVRGVDFSYYLNPTPNDRNLEYDQLTNLAPGADIGAVYLP